MFGFYIKKAFFDGWDNFVQLVLQNLVYVCVIALILVSGLVAGESEFFFLVLVGLVLLLFCVCLGGTASVAHNWANYNSDTWKAFGKGIRRNLAHSLLFFGMLVALLFLISYAIPFYMALSNIIGTIISVLLFWVFAGFLLALPYYFPLMMYLPGDGPFKTMKKCFIVLFDNLGFTILLFLHNLVDLVLSVFTMGIFTGVAGVMLGCMDAGKLLMKKYDWQEENPGKNAKEMDWDEVLYEEKENLGPRTIKNMIFPWK